MENKLKYNSSGIWVSQSGKVFKDKEGKNEITPKEDSSGYLYIDFDDLPNLKEDKTSKIHGKYLHRIIVFTFGDCNRNKI